MKKALFLLVSVLLSGMTYASNLGKDVKTKIMNSEQVSIAGQNAPLVLEQPTDVQTGVSDHYSHSSHSSHRSHYSSRMS